MSKLRLVPNEDFVPREKAYANALLEGAKYSLSSAPETGKQASLSLNSKALEIFDINGQLLFYDFALLSGRTQVATIRAAANSTIGKPIISIRLGAQKWNLTSSKSKIGEIVKKKFSSYKVLNTLLVCYSYPKIGLLVNLVNEKEKLQVIFDISDYSIIPSRPEKEGFEGAYSWSFLDSINKRTAPARRKKFQLASELAKRVFGREYEGEIIYRISDIAKVRDLSKLVLKTRVEKKLQFCTHYSHTEDGSHHCFILHAQQVNDYCSVATCQMILCYYRYYYAQNTIAPSLGYSSGGGCPPDVSAGYESLSNNHLNATYDTSATWNEARDQINLLQPMKSGVPGHARAVAGYSQNLFTILGTSDSDQKLFVYDPWPWNADFKAGGDIYWEDWDSITHTNFVYTKLDY